MMHKGTLLRYLFCLGLAACSKSSAQAPAAGHPPPAGLPSLGEGGQTMGVHGETAGEAPNLPPGHPQLPPGHPSTAGGGMDMQQDFDPSRIKVDPTKVISGAIQLSPKMKDKVKPGDVLFISVRQEQQGMPGPILAVDRLEARDFPIPFMIDGHKAMVPGTEFKGKAIITVRDDKDGDAMTKNPGDVQGTTTVEIPAKHVVVTLDTELK